MVTLARGKRRGFQRRVLAWYAVNGRDLPWRKTRDPYAILICEILSHQTQIARVVPVYETLLSRYPTVQSMARAPLETVTAITDPLGYKIRGRWLHAAALQVADRGGAFPRTIDGLRELAGVGRYTAGAMMSFAYRRDAPMLDTNIARVLSRHFDGRNQRPGQARLWQLAAAVIPKGKAYLMNQGLMDVGALICRARSPLCDVCPLRRSCAFRRGSARRSLKRRD